MIDTTPQFVQMEIFDSPPQKGPLLNLLAARDIGAGIESLPRAGIILIQGPPRAGVTSAIEVAIQRAAIGNLNVFSPLTPEDTISAAVASLCVHFRELPGAKIGQKTIKEMVDVVVESIARNNVRVMVFEHMEHQQKQFDRVIVDIVESCRKRGMEIFFIVHFCVLRNKARDLDKALSERLSCQYWMDKPNESAVLSVFCLNLRTQSEAVATAISVKPRASYVTAFSNRVVAYIDGNMCRAVTLAERLSYFFGTRPVDEEYFVVVTAFLAESDPLSLYPKSR